jgi:cytidylate kinase
MYRALTWLALERGVDLEDESALGRLAWETAIRVVEESEERVLIDGQEVWEELRHPEVDRAVSLVSRIPEVRSALVKQQQQIAVDGRIVVAGRDIGTVVLPEADLKLFLVASVSRRAKRRYMELTAQGYSVEYAEVLDDLKARDELDTGRPLSPLRPARDAYLLDTDDIDVKQVTEKVLERIGRQ